MQAVADEHDTADNDADALEFGRVSGSIDHVVPFHASARGASLPDSAERPTAMQ
jgi:hypothetical protein